MKKIDIKKYIKKADDVELLSSEIMKEYNDIINQMVEAIDSDYVMNKFQQAKQIADELELILSSAGTVKKKSFMSSLFGSDEKKVATNLKGKADIVLNKYKECLEALKKTVEMQIGKGMVMEKFVKHFEQVEIDLETIIPTLSQETMEQKIVYSGLSSFLKNMKKMSISMKQKMAIMEGSIISSMGLKEEMVAGMYHFESLIKDILISMSFDNIIKSSANIINGFRDIVEKYNESMAKSMIDTAQEVQDIKSKGVVSIQALESMGGFIQEASNTFKALADKRVRDDKETKSKLANLQQQSSDLRSEQGNFLTHNKS